MYDTAHADHTCRGFLNKDTALDIFYSVLSVVECACDHMRMMHAYNRFQFNNNSFNLDCKYSNNNNILKGIE